MIFKKGDMVKYSSPYSINSYFIKDLEYFHNVFEVLGMIENNTVIIIKSKYNIERNLSQLNLFNERFWKLSGSEFRKIHSVVEEKEIDKLFEI